MRAQEAKQIAIVDYLSLAGVQPRKERSGGKELWYSSPIRDGDSDPSFKVDIEKNLWFDFGLDKGGNVLDLVMEHQGATVKEALAILEGTGLYTGDVGKKPGAGGLNAVSATPGINKAITEILSPALSDTLFLKGGGVNKVQVPPGNGGLNFFAGEKEKNPAFEILGVGEVNRAALLSYLSERAINVDIARMYLKQLYYKPRGKKRGYYALAWECGDGYEARSRFFKGFIGNHKDFIKINLRDHQSLSIFEGFMDFLAFLTYYDKKDFKSSVIILNSTNLKNKAVEEIKKYNFSKVYLFLDNDKSGDIAKEFFVDSLKNTPIVDKSHLYDRHNDFNEMIIEDLKNAEH